MILIVITLLIVAVLAPFMGIYFNLDPTYFILRDVHLLQSNLWIQLIVRFALVTWGALETTRSCALYALIIVSLCRVVLSCIKIISQRFPDNKAIRLYNQLHCINQIGQQPLRWYAGMLMTSGFAIGIIGSWVVLRGYKTFPIVIYLLITAVVIAVFITASQALPKIVECHKYSEYMLNVIWRKESIKYWQRRLNLCQTGNYKPYQIWKRVEKAQRPLNFYYGSAKFDQETKTNFFNIILNHSVSLILVT